MLCENCRDREATVHLSQNINGVYSEINLCAECLLEVFSSGNILGKIKDRKNGIKIENSDHNIKAVVLCSNCGISLDEYLTDNSLGCSECKREFLQFMTPLDIDFENGEKKESDNCGKMEGYQDKLVKAVLDEDYEYAAFLRDRIRDLDTKNQQ